MFDLFLKQVQAAVAKASTNARLKALLNQLTDFPNIPRKKAKFEVSVATISHVVL